MTIKLGKIKVVWFEKVFGWIMTGIIGPDGKWFFGYSQKPYPVHDNSDLRELLQKAIEKANDSDHFVEQLHFKTVDISKVSGMEEITAESLRDWVVTLPKEAIKRGETKFGVDPNNAYMETSSASEKD